MPVEIIGNYFHKFFACENMFLAMSLSSSSIDQRNFQQDLISNLVLHSKLDHATYKILDTLDQPRRANKKIFNLILTDEIASLK